MRKIPTKCPKCGKTLNIYLLHLAQVNKVEFEGMEHAEATLACFDKDCFYTWETKDPFEVVEVARKFYAPLSKTKYSNADI